MSNDKLNKLGDNVWREDVVHQRIFHNEILFLFPPLKATPSQKIRFTVNKPFQNAAIFDEFQDFILHEPEAIHISRTTP